MKTGPQVKTTKADPSLSSPLRPLLQRKCACGGSPGAHGECAECQKKRLDLQRKPEGHSQPSTAPPVVGEVLRSQGQPLDNEARSFMESRLGHDFSRVRVHTDAKAGESAEAVSSLAYTVGEHIVFRSGQYNPVSTEGRRLLAHELSHVLQQRPESRLSRQVAGESRPVSVTPVTYPLLSRQVIGRCLEMGVPCPAPYATHGTICRLVDCIPAASANLPFAVSPGVCVYHCIDGRVCACVMVGTKTSAVCTFTFCESPGQASVEPDFRGFAERAVAMATQESVGQQGGTGSREPAVQAKLEINVPGDRYEQEADRIAETVIRDSAGSSVSAIATPFHGSLAVQRQTTAGQPRRPSLVPPVAPNPQQNRAIESARRAAAIRTQVALMRLRGIVPAGPPNVDDPSQSMRDRATSLARVMFDWDNPNMGQIEEVVGSMVSHLASPQVMIAGQGDPECGGRAAYVRGLRPPIILCPTFFSDTPEQQIRTMIHESAHLARIGAADLNESYCAVYDCAGSCGGFDSADGWAQFVHCLSGQTPDRPTAITGRRGAQSPQSGQGGRP